jgi:phenylalanyl-tRNA synthetase beta chain
MHCFDADEIRGDIIVRNARRGEEFKDLFGNTHELAETDLVITDGAGILALAGVVGGMRGMTTDRTTNVLLECAYFEPVGVRKTSKRIGVSTDSSYRYERGIDPTATEPALARAAAIIRDACGGEIANVAVGGATPEHNVRIEYSPSLFLRKTGIDLNVAEQKRILESLGFAVDTSGDNWTVTPTPARVDVVIPENIVSELIRLYGYDNIKQGNTADGAGFATSVPNVKKILASRGFFECMNYGFGDSAKDKLLSARSGVSILNPIIDTFDTARNSLVQSMLDTIAGNDRFRRSNLALFELAAVFDGAQPGQQHDQLVLARAGVAGDKIGVKHGAAASIYDIRADLRAIFPNAVAENDDNPPKWAHPFRAGRMTSDGRVVAEFAELHPAIAKRFGIKTDIVIGLVDDVSALTRPVAWTAEPKSGRQIALAEFPLITRDFAFIADGNTAPADLTHAAQSADPRIIETNIFDVFDMPDGKKSIAFEIVIQPLDNMSDKDLQTLQTAVIDAVQGACGAKLRG